MTAHHGDDRVHETRSARKSSARGTLAERASEGHFDSLSADELAAYDADHVWHPYGAFPASTLPLVVDSASGVALRLADGREVIDGMSSWWAAVHGYQIGRAHV